MKNKPVISSLQIKKLFGVHDLSIDFQNLTVIVGKNGMGKTTLLKIINGMITGSDHVDYAEICESIELGFSDGNYVCYGILNDGILQATNTDAIAKYYSMNENIPPNLLAILDNVAGIEGMDRDALLKDLIKTLLSTSDFKKYANEYYKSKLNIDKRQLLARDEHLDELKNNVHVRYISTVNISANAGTKMDFGNSIEKNLLDLAIYEEIRILLSKKKSLTVNLFIKKLNEFLIESGKTAKMSHGECIFITDEDVRLNLSQLSSGERQLVYILATAANTCGQQALFLMDEPEVSLHLSWQEKVIDSIMSINPLMQIIAVTHSPGIIMNGHMDAYVEMKDLLKGTENV